MSVPPKRKSSKVSVARSSRPEVLEFLADVLVIGGGPAGAWAALTARRNGCDVILADKGYFGTSGATAPSNTETWCVPPGSARDRAVDKQRAKTNGLSDDDHVHRVLESAWRGLGMLAADRHPFAVAEDGEPYLGNLRGPDYMRHLRRLVISAGVRVLDHHPAIELLGGDDGVGGASGVDRQRGNPWRIRAGAVVLATGGCAFGERFIGATGLTGDGYLMAVEAGAELSGMEYASQYAVAPAGSSMNKGMPYRFASCYESEGRHLGEPGEDRQEFIADALAKGPVFACLDKADETRARWLRQGQPNCFLPFDRAGIDPFSDHFEIVLRCEGTVRGVGGIRLTGPDGETGVPGLYAAGDVVSRERLVGAISGGGGPNSSWAIASGQWAGKAAARYASRARGHASRELVPLGKVGTRAYPAHHIDAAEVMAEVSAVMLPVSHNFYREGTQLDASSRRLETAWRDVRSSDAARTSTRGLFSSRTIDYRWREATAMLATARWVLASATMRTETRGMHRRVDHPAWDHTAPRRILVTGLDDIRTRGDADDVRIAARPLSSVSSA